MQLWKEGHYLQWVNLGTERGGYALNLPALIDMNGFEQLEKVADLVMQGKSEYQIARTLKIKVIEAKSYMAQFHEVLQSDMDAKDAAREYLNTMVARYERLIEQANDNLADLKALAFDEKVSAQINSTLKNIADFDAKRVDLLQKAGLLDAADVGDEVARMEERHAMIINLLQNDLCGDCKNTIRDKMSILTGQVHGDVIDGEVVDE